MNVGLSRVFLKEVKEIAIRKVKGMKNMCLAIVGLGHNSDFSLYPVKDGILEVDEERNCQLFILGKA